jgi:hypothetical protein
MVKLKIHHKEYEILEECVLKTFPMRDGLELRHIHFSVLNKEEKYNRFTLELRIMNKKYVPVRVIHWDLSYCPFCDHKYLFNGECPELENELNLLLDFFQKNPKTRMDLLF